jgi:hypothetical protein
MSLVGRRPVARWDQRPLHFTRTNMIGPLVHANASVLIFTAQPYATNAIPLDAKLFQVPC